MKLNKKHPMQENTKDDSSDIEKVKADKTSPPPRNEQRQTPQGRAATEEEEAQKGHS